MKGLANMCRRSLRVVKLCALAYGALIAAQVLALMWAERVIGG